MIRALRNLRCRSPWMWAHVGPMMRYEKGKPDDTNVIPYVPGATPVGRDLWARCQWCGAYFETNALGEWIRVYR